MAFSISSGCLGYSDSRVFLGGRDGMGGAATWRRRNRKDCLRQGEGRQRPPPLCWHNSSASKSGFRQLLFCKEKHAEGLQTLVFWGHMFSKKSFLGNILFVESLPTPDALSISGSSSSRKKIVWHGLLSPFASSSSSAAAVFLRYFLWHFAPPPGFEWAAAVLLPLLFSGSSPAPGHRCTYYNTGGGGEEENVFAIPGSMEWVFMFGNSIPGQKKK